VVDYRGGTDTTEAWTQLKKGAIAVAVERLGSYNQLLYQAVDQWSDEAETKIEGIEGPSERGLGLGLFNVLSEVVGAVFMPQKVAANIALEAIKAFSQAVANGLNDAGKQSVEKVYQNAQHQLNQIVDQLKKATAASAKLGWEEAKIKVDDDIDALFAAFPEYASLPYGDDLTSENWLAAQIGIFDPHEDDPTERITRELWEKFNPDFERLTAKVRWADMGHVKKMEHLDGMADDDERRTFLRWVGADVDYWMDQHLDWSRSKGWAP
jgi:hypothetical protein